METAEMDIAHEQPKYTNIVATEIQQAINCVEKNNHPTIFHQVIQSNTTVESLDTYT